MRRMMQLISWKSRVQLGCMLTSLNYMQVEAKVREKAAQGKLSDLTIPDMKCFLKGRKLAVAGKKADLVASVGESLASMA